MLALAATSCADGDDAAETAASRGEKIYRNACVTCHGDDPNEEGSIGPAIAGASVELVHAKVVHGKYPPGYTPKRGSQQMPPLPYLEDHVPAIAAYLQTAAGG